MSGRLSDIPTGSLENDAATIQELLQYSDDLQIKDFRRENDQLKLLFFDTLTDTQSIHERVLQPMFYQSPDDYNSRRYAGTFFRLIRLISFFIAISLPAIYIATVAFRFEILPSNMIIAIKQSIDKVPYPPLVEAFIMEITIELIREAGIRLPSPLGQTIGVIGGIVIGQAVVQANLVSNIMVIVVAITAIAAYVVPSNEMGTAVRLLRFGFMISAATLGLLGIVLSFTLLLIHLCALESFGTPYLAPLSTGKWRNLKDTMARFPMWKMTNRPVDAAPQKNTQETISRGWQPDDPR